MKKQKQLIKKLIKFVVIKGNIKRPSKKLIKKINFMYSL